MPEQYTYHPLPSKAPHRSSTGLMKGSMATHHHQGCVRGAVRCSSGMPQQPLISLFLQPLISLFSPSRQQEAVVEKLLALVENTQLGAAADPAGVADQALQLVEELNQPPSAAEKLDGLWQLVYTTEASVHQLVRWAGPGLFVTQNIDVKSAERVTNDIEFSKWLKIQATAPLTVDSKARISYVFDALFLQILGVRLQIPFVRGGGWTEAVYCSNAVRVMRNSQKDTLVFVRVMD
eukprot:CAMPEP_0119113856 /NCGR_PEP_ID=MMETSP1180-20130426/45387_1 /TAXON_ID=3052 ORGANISM="Chlamydomonas cf sp, Strain CCMP681" /NCGR_SAMPLE_ID=MMETSP1180 /ASSEMBLY_ACC=CAM_ASM_000741 /LENGTH=234 /DNA_ID=CAMNT_0007102121 /DNA_START=67 /DNA_END=771 /DNA_ORIENTATION=-